MFGDKIKHRIQKIICYYQNKINMQFLVIRNEKSRIGTIKGGGGGGF